MICELYDIVAVPFPFMERPAIKRRPAIAISSERFNRDNRHSIFAMITTARLERWPDDYALEKPIEAGLVQDCFVRFKIFTLPNDLIVKKVGRPVEEDRAALGDLLKRIMPV